MKIDLWSLYYKNLQNKKLDKLFEEIEKVLHKPKEELKLKKE